MDIKEFSNEDFNPIDFINSSYKNSDQKSSKESFVASLLSHLQINVNETNSNLEDVTQQILIGLPRIMKNSSTIHSEVSELKTKLKEIQLEIDRVQNQTGDCMTNLEYLDSLKEKLQIAKEGLQESDGWGKLITELEDLYERNDLWKICDKLQLLQKSLAAQEKLPGQAEREAQVDGFKNRLEALASPAVVQCFSTTDADQAKKYIKLFKGMERMPQFLQYYRTVQKSAIQQHWNEVLDLSENSNRFLKDFYEYLVEIYQKQCKWCANVFGDDGIDQPIMVAVEILKSLQPSRESQILNSLKQSNEKLEVLKEFSEANKHCSYLFKMHLQNVSPLPPKDQLKSLSSAIFDYFNTFINQYPAIEQNYLATSLANLNLSSQTTATETIRGLGNANKKIFEWTKESLIRCEKITENCAITALASVLNSIYKSYIEKYKKAQVQLAASKNIEENWSLIQSCMSLLQNFGDFNLSLREFEMQLQDKILKTYQKHEALPLDYFGYRLAEKRDKNDLNKLYQKIQKLKETETENNVIVYGSIFETIYQMIKPICAEIHDSTLSAVFKPIEQLLENVEPELDNTNSSMSNLPDYSYAPQEFITQIGQYLLTLPQHLEPILISPSEGLKLSLEICDDKYKETGSDIILLSLVLEECCVMYLNQILGIKLLNNSAAKQIATDIEYLNNVLEELGSNITPHLQQIVTLLRAPSENYLSASSGLDPRLVSAVRQMRNIISTE